MFEVYHQLEPRQLEEIRKILIIQQKPFGDILLNTGYLPELRKHFPDAQIDYLIERPYLTILEDNPHLDNLVIMEKPKGKGLRYLVEQITAARRVRKRGYDLIIDQLRGTSSARMVIFSGAKYRLGWITKRWNFIYNVRIPQAPRRYKSLYKFDLLAPLGIIQPGLAGGNRTFHFGARLGQGHVRPFDFILQPGQHLAFFDQIAAVDFHHVQDAGHAAADVNDQVGLDQTVQLSGLSRQTD